MGVVVQYTGNNKVAYNPSTGKVITRENKRCPNCDTAPSVHLRVTTQNLDFDLCGCDIMGCYRWVGSYSGIAIVPWHDAWGDTCLWTSPSFIEVGTMHECICWQDGYVFCTDNNPRSLYMQINVRRMPSRIDVEYWFYFKYGDDYSLITPGDEGFSGVRARRTGLGSSNCVNYSPNSPGLFQKANTWDFHSDTLIAAADVEEV